MFLDHVITTKLPDLGKIIILLLVPDNAFPALIPSKFSAVRDASSDDHWSRLLDSVYIHFSSQVYYSHIEGEVNSITKLNIFIIWVHGHQRLIYVTFHDKTMHIAPTTDFDLRPPFYQLQPLNCCSCKFEVTSPCGHGDMSKNTPGSPVLKFCKKHNETLLHTLHVEIRILTVYANTWPHPLSQ